MFTLIPEWAPNAAIWIGWPSDPLLWGEDLEPAEAEVAGLVEALAGGEPLIVLASGPQAAARARAALGARAEVVETRFGDIWLRDTGPVFGLDQGRLAARLFRFNGWGGKYQLDGDEAVGAFMAERSGAATDAPR